MQGGANMQRYATATYLLFAAICSFKVLDPCMQNFLRITKKVTEQGKSTFASNCKDIFGKLEHKHFCIQKGKK